MTVIKNEESRGKGFLDSTDGNPGFNPIVGLQLGLYRGVTKFFGMHVRVVHPIHLFTVGIPAPTDFSSPPCYQGIEMKGDDRGYRGRVFQICKNTLHEIDGGQEQYRGILEFKSGEKQQFISSISKLREQVEYELYAGGLDSRPTTGTVIRIVEIREVSER